MTVFAVFPVGIYFPLRKEANHSTQCIHGEAIHEAVP